MAYEKKLVAFVDVLGFKNKTNQITANEKTTLHQNLISIKNYINNLNSQYNSDTPQQIKSFRFSDSCMFSAPLEKLNKLLCIIYSMQLHFAANDFFMRGGVTYAEIYDRDDFFYGKGLNQAYKLESEKATYPRIILDPKIFNNWTNAGSIPEYNLSELTSILRKDFDNIIYINFFAPPDEHAREYFNNINMNQHNENLIKIKANIDKNITACRQDPSILAKYIWLLENYCLNNDSENERPQIFYKAKTPK